MNKQKKLLLLLGLNFLILLSVPMGFSSAQLHSYGPGISIQELMYSITMATGFIFGAFAVVCFVVYGVLFLTANGDPGKLDTAKRALLWGVIGVIVGIIAFSIVGIIGGMLSGGSFFSF